MRVAVTATIAIALVAVGASSGTTTPGCGTGVLRLAPTFYGEAGGQFVQTLTATNVSRSDCALAGWPRVRIEDRRHRLVSLRIRRVVQGSLSPPYAPVRLAHRGQASFH